MLGCGALEHLSRLFVQGAFDIRKEVGFALANICAGLWPLTPLLPLLPLFPPTDILLGSILAKREGGMRRYLPSRSEVHAQSPCSQAPDHAHGSCAWSPPPHALPRRWKPQIVM